MTKNYNDLGVEFKYLIVNDMDQKYGLWVNTVGFQSIQPNSPYPLKDHPTGYFFNAQLSQIITGRADFGRRVNFSEMRFLSKFYKIWLE